MKSLLPSILAGALACSALAHAQDVVTINPPEYTGALRNPLMGISPKNYNDKAIFGSYQALRGMHPWGTLSRTCIPWSWLENDEKDGVEKIRAVSDQLFAGFENHNTKVMPRVYLLWPGKEENITNPLYMHGEFWPADMQKQDISSEQFKARLKRFIARLGEACDNDPRVGIIEMGIIGKWGEQTDPVITPEMEKLLGDAFKEAFKNKKIMTRVRPMTNFDAYPFGLLWDSFSHQDQLDRDGKIMADSTRWKVAPFGGETAYDWGNCAVQPGKNPTDNLADPVHRDFTVNLARKLHMTQLGWVADYDQSNPQAAEGAEALQKALGYRFVLSEVSFPKTVAPGKTFNVAFKVRNDGSAPFYENWPVALFLLDPNSREIVWQGTFGQTDLRQWVPGENWDEIAKAYSVPPKVHEERGEFEIPATVPKGEYVLALGVLDPQGGMVPTLRFSNQNYWNGGYHPIGLIGVGVTPSSSVMDAKTFNDPGLDQTIHYINPHQTPEQRAALDSAEKIDPLFLLRPLNWWGLDGMNGATGSVEVRNVTQSNPAVILKYDFTNVKKWGCVGVATDLRVRDNVKALTFVVKSDAPAEICATLIFSNGQKFEHIWKYDTAGQNKELELPLEASKLSGNQANIPMLFPLTGLRIRANTTPECAKVGTVELTDFRAITR
ncbi:MAG: DUF4832 domain-containing protein [Terrimicrobiaceae bacterium]